MIWAPFIALYLLPLPVEPMGFGDREGTRSTLDEARQTSGKLLLSIVIPCYNANKNVLGFLKRLFSELGDSRELFEVYLVDDMSTDGLAPAIQQQRFDQTSNFYFIEQTTQQGAGQARNRVIPQLRGLYTYFLDADDDAHIKPLWEAMLAAKKEGTDLMFLPYNISQPKKKVMTTRAMWPGDEKLWHTGLANEKKNLSKEQLLLRNKEAAFGITNYPWIRLIRTKMLQEAHILFGPTPVHNDVQFHWHSIAVAKSVVFFDKPVCLHRKNPSMKQITNIATKDRVALVDALRLTDLMLQRCGFYDGPASAQFVQVLIDFIKHLVQWAKKLVPEECKDLYGLRTRALLAQLKKAKERKGIAPEEDFSKSSALSACPIKVFTVADLEPLKEEKKRRNPKGLHVRPVHFV